MSSGALDDHFAGRLNDRAVRGCTSAAITLLLSASKAAFILSYFFSQ
jgi:hypothetical protein